MTELLPLTGTPKQIKWATILRDRYVAEMRRCGRGAWGDDRQLRAFAAILAHAEAVWWINSRWLTLDNLVQFPDTVPKLGKRVTNPQSEGERRLH